MTDQCQTWYRTGGNYARLRMREQSRARRAGARGLPIPMAERQLGDRGSPADVASGPPIANNPYAHPGAHLRLRDGIGARLLYRPMLRQVKIIVEKHADGYVAYPLGLKGVVVGDGNAGRLARSGSFPRPNFPSMRRPRSAEGHSRRREHDQAANGTSISRARVLGSGIGSPSSAMPSR